MQAVTREVWAPGLVFNINEVQCKIKAEMGQKACHGGKKEFKSDFFKAESMGVEPPGHCKKHINTNCPDFSFKVQRQSKNEVYEYAMLEQGFHYNNITTGGRMRSCTRNWRDN